MLVLECPDPTTSVCSKSFYGGKDLVSPPRVPPQEFGSYWEQCSRSVTGQENVQG